MPEFSICLSECIQAQLDELAERKDVGLNNLIQDAFQIGLQKILIKDAMEQYQHGEKSAWACAEGAGISLWEFLEFLKQKDIPFRTDEEEIESELRRFVFQ